MGVHCPDTGGAGLALPPLTLEPGAINRICRFHLFFVVFCEANSREFVFWGEGPIVVGFFKATKMVLMYSQGGESVSKIISKASAGFKMLWFCNLGSVFLCYFFFRYS